MTLASLGRMFPSPSYHNQTLQTTSLPMIPVEQCAKYSLPFKRPGTVFGRVELVERKGMTTELQILDEGVVWKNPHPSVRSIFAVYNTGALLRESTVP